MFPAKPALPSGAKRHIFFPLFLYISDAPEHHKKGPNHTEKENFRAKYHTLGTKPHKKGKPAEEARQLSQKRESITDSFLRDIMNGL